MEKRPDKQSEILKIAVTGPESTGKSTLTEQLADKFHVSWVEEYARQFLQNRDGSYNEADLLQIAEGQRTLERKKEAEAHGLLFCDTELIVIKIWSLVKFGRCDNKILEWLEKQDYRHYFLCNIDVPWQDDPLREHPHMRKELFDMYIRELNFYGFAYTVISGSREERLLQAETIVKKMLNQA